MSPFYGIFASLSGRELLADFGLEIAVEQINRPSFLRQGAVPGHHRTIAGDGLIIDVLALKQDSFSLVLWQRFEFTCFYRREPTGKPRHSDDGQDHGRKQWMINGQRNDDEHHKQKSRELREIRSSSWDSIADGIDQPDHGTEKVK